MAGEFGKVVYGRGASVTSECPTFPFGGAPWRFTGLSFLISPSCPQPGLWKKVLIFLLTKTTFSLVFSF